MLRKNELFNIMDNYFSKYSLITAKSARLALIRDFYQLRLYRKSTSDTLEQFNK